MGLTDKLQNKKEQMEAEVRSRVEEFNALIRVYLQATLATNLGIVDLRMLPDLKLLKQKFKIQTEGRLGNAEKNYVRKLMKSEYKMSDTFFNEIDASTKRICKRQQDIQNYFYLYQGLSQELFMALAADMQMVLRLPSFFRSWIKSSTKDTIHKIITANGLKSADAIRAAANFRQYNEKFRFSEEWMLQYAYPILMISKGSKV